MRLPNAQLALVESAKVRDYLLSTRHPVGGFKAAFFLSLGYSPAGWQGLATDQIQIIANFDAIPSEPNAFGKKFVVRGT